MIHQFARFQVKEEDLDSAIEVVKEFVSKVNLEEKNTILYRSMKDKVNKTYFIHYMIFKDEEAMQYHQQTPWVKRFVEQLYPLCSMQPVFDKLEVIGHIVREKEFF